VARITDRLTYDCSNKKAQILLQPLIRLGGKVLWSPWVVRKSRHDRNILKLMARTPELKLISDNVVGQRERAFLNLIGRHLAKKSGYQYKINTDISNGVQFAEIDLLAYRTRVPQEVLIVEAKTILAVDETNEIADATDKLISAQRQVLSTLDILKALDVDRRRLLFRFVDWSKVSDYYPLVMTPDSHPNTLYSDQVVPHVTFASLANYVKPRDVSRPSRIWLTCRDKDWIKQRTPARHYAFKDVAVGNLTYSLPYVKIHPPGHEVA